MYPLYERRERLARQARLRSLLLELARDEVRTFVRTLVRLPCWCGGTGAPSRHPSSTRWGSALAILRHRLQRDLEDLQQCRRRRGESDDNSAQGDDAADDQSA